jgi:hypothetical protein
VAGKITQFVEFDELPEHAAQYVLYSALIEACATDLGNQPELNLWMRLAAQAWDDVVAEHLRQKQYNTRKTQTWLKFRRSLQA